MIKAWSGDAWDDYLYWHEQGNKSNIKKLTS
ncbi:Plasmid encoded toxin, Txe/YoeB family [Enterococcus hirae]|nr:Plasmid encoded toxin, Txe/YoeB family [Enterococcus hirae]